jgi:hypothetical protein
MKPESFTPRAASRFEVSGIHRRSVLRMSSVVIRTMFGRAGAAAATVWFTGAAPLEARLVPCPGPAADNATTTDTAAATLYPNIA